MHTATAVGHGKVVVGLGNLEQSVGLGGSGRRRALEAAFHTGKQRANLVELLLGFLLPGIHKLGGAFPVACVARLAYGQQRIG